MDKKTISFEDLVTLYACTEGVEFCRKHQWDFQAIMTHAHEYLADYPKRRAREEVLLGLRLTLGVAKRLPRANWEYEALRIASDKSDLSDPLVWDSMTDIYTRVYHSCGVRGKGIDEVGPLCWD